VQELHDILALYLWDALLVLKLWSQRREWTSILPYLTSRSRNQHLSSVLLLSPSCLCFATFHLFRCYKATLVSSALGFSHFLDTFGLFFFRLESRSLTPLPFSSSQPFSSTLLLTEQTMLTLPSGPKKSRAPKLSRKIISSEISSSLIFLVFFLSFLLSNEMYQSCLTKA